MKIQEVMKLQRKALGITQQDLADMSEIAISTIKKIESGKGNPSLSTVEKIMDILGMEVKYEIRQQFKYSLFLPICFQKEQTER
jgi:transcriptional regulator with XRE-family HTH domain